MNTVKTLFILLILFFVTAESSAQGPRRRGPVARKPATQPVAQPELVPSPATAVAVPSAPVPLALVNGQSITSADINPKVREEVEALEGRIAEARRQVLELQVNTLLLEGEAAKRKLTPQQLYDLEITRRITEPTAAEIDKFIQDNRDQINQTDPVAMRQQVVAYLKGEREAKITDDFIKRLRTATPVVNLASIDAASLAPGAVLATVGGRPITAGTLSERLKPIVYKLRLNTYQLAKQALDLTINDLLLLAEATRSNVPPEEIVRKEISEKVRPPSEADVAKFYEDNKARISAPLAEASNQIASYLQEQDRQRLESALSERLRAGAGPAPVNTKRFDC